jgi:hypothetical protein
MGDHASGHCRCDRCRMRIWIVWLMLSLALLFASAGLLIRVLWLL